MSIEWNKCIFALTSLRLALVIVYFLVMNNKRCNFSKVEQHPKRLEHSTQTRKSIWHFLHKIMTDEKLLTLWTCQWSEQFSRKSSTTYQGQTEVDRTLVKKVKLSQRGDKEKHKWLWVFFVVQKSRKKPLRTSFT